MRETSHAIVAIVIVITSHLLRPASKKKCQTVILHRVIEKLPCDPRFTSPYSMSVNRLNVLMTVMIAFAFLAAESGNAVNGYPQFNQKRQLQHVPNVQPQKYCGQKLSNALQIICDGLYNSMFKKNVREEANTGHKSINLDYGRTQEMEMADYPLTYAYDYSPFMPRARAQRMLEGRYRRQPRGIHEECCVNACTISELSSYCAVPIKTAFR